MTEPGTQPAGEWHRLHPITIVREVGALIWAFAAAVAFDIRPPGIPREAEYVEVVVGLAVFGAAIARYLATRYRVGQEALEVKRGVVVRTERSMPLSRIHNVSIDTGILGRLFGVRTVDVSAADIEEIKLSYVTAAQAGELRTILLASTRQPQEDEPEEQRSAFASLDPGGLVLYSLSGGEALVAAVALVVTVSGALLGGQPWVLVSTGWLAAILMAQSLNLYGFTATVTAERMHVTHGLLRRQEKSALLSRFQLVEVARPPIRRRLGFETLRTATGDVSTGEAAVTIGVVAPLIPLGSWLDRAAPLVGRPGIGETDLRPVHRGTVRRAFVRGLTPTLVGVLGVVAAASVVGASPWWAAVPAGVGGAASLGYARLRYRRLGWAVDDHHVLVARGVVVPRLWAVPVAKVQDVTVSATWFQRRLGMASVWIDTAGVGLGGGPVAVDLAADDAARLGLRLVTAAHPIALPDGV